MLLLGCASNSQKIDTNNLNSLQSINFNSVDASSSDVSNIRSQGVQEAALTLGAQSGLASRAKEINARLDRNVTNMRTTFNFSALMLAHGVQPPILIESDNSLNYSGPNALRVSDKTYKIIEPAQFITTPLTWRNYLWMNYTKPEIPNKTLLPKNAEEQAVWRKYVAIGWEQGIKQADSIFQQNLARLKRDYNGMILYRKLLEQHMISEPYVATTSLGVTGDGNTLNINDQVLRITATPQLQTDSSEWKPILVQ